MAEQYDNNNRGAAFTPYPEQKLFLQGKLQIDHEDHQIALITNETRDGKTAIDVYGKLGRLFLNDNQKDEINKLRQNHNELGNNHTNYHLLNSTSCHIIHSENENE